MPAAVGHPTTAMVPVHGGEFGNDTEASVSQLLVDAFGEGVVEALQEITATKGKEIALKRAESERAELARAAKEDDSRKQADHAVPSHHASPLVTPHGKPYGNG